LAMLDQLGGREAGEAMAFTAAHPADDAPIELHADVADVTRTDVVRPRMRRREVGQAARAAQDDASRGELSIDHAPQRLAKRVAARGAWRWWMHRIHEHGDDRRAALAHEIEDRLDVCMGKQPAVSERGREADVETLLQASFDESAGDFRV